MEPLDGTGLRALEPLMQGWSPEGWAAEGPVKPKPKAKASSDQLPLFG